MAHSQLLFRRWLDSNRGPLVSEATALPTEPQPLPNVWLIFELLNFCSFNNTNATAKANAKASCPFIKTIAFAKYNYQARVIEQPQS